MSVVVLATNDSPACRRAVVRAGTLFEDSDFLVAMVVCGAGAGDSAAMPIRAASDRIAVDAAAAVVRGACARLGPRARPAVIRGEPGLALCSLAEAEMAEVIVVGSLGADGITSLVNRPVAAALVERARCPVVEMGQR